MRLSVTETLTVSRAIANAYDPRFTVVSVISADGEAERVELLLRFGGDLPEASDSILDLNRSNPIEFERELRSKLADALLEHLTR